jgi:hypothetical protein
MPPAAAAVNNNGAGARQRRAVNLQQLQQQQQSQQQQPQQHSKPWFSGAPITKIICIIWVAGSLWVIRNNGDDENTHSNRNNNNNHNYTNLWVSALWNGPSNWFFASSTELIVVLSFLVHYLRRLEQELSSRRFIAWLFTLEIVYIFIRLVAVVTFDEDVTHTFVGGGTTAAKGPYLFVGAVLYWYKTYVPRLYPRFLSSSTLGISCSEKTFPYLCAAYILFMRGTASLLVGFIGMVASGIFFFLLSLSTNNSSGSSNIPFIDVPDIIVNMLPWESMGSLFFLDPNPKVYAPYFTRGTAMNIRPGGGGGGPRRNRGQQQQGGRTTTRRVPMAGPAQPSAGAAAAMSPPPPPEAIAQLTSMGFDEQRVKEALQVSDNNVETAANLLLMGS